MPRSTIAAPRTTVIIPTYDEASTIEACLEALADQDVGAAGLEVLVVDGFSTDDTVAAARRFIDARSTDPGFGAWRVMVNEGRSRPSNLNRGLREATAAVICRVDARSRVPSHYVRTCQATLASRPDVAVVGGRQRASGGATTASIGIARAVNNRWAMGGATYRRAAVPGPADTVYLGAFRTAQLRSAGGWDETLAVNEDFDLNRRMRSHGLVWFDPTLEVAYLPRPSLAGLSSQYWDLGRGKARYLLARGERPRPRQVVAAAALPALVVVGIVAMRVRRLRRYALAVGAAVAAAVEVLGADGPPGSPTAHAAAAAASAVIAGSWTAGLWTELLRSVAPSR